MDGASPMESLPSHKASTLGELGITDVPEQTLDGGRKRSATESQATVGSALKKPRSIIRLISAEAFGLRGKRPSMEDAHAIHLDLHSAAYQMIVPLEGGGKPSHHLCSDLASRIDANLLGGLSRKAAVRFARRLASVRNDFFSPDGNCLPPPHMAFLGVYDGHCGRRAADFCKKWLHLYIYFAFWKLYCDPLETTHSTTSPESASQASSSAPVNAATAQTGRHIFDFPRKDLEKVLAEAFQEMDDAFLEEAESNNWNDGCTVLCCVTVDNDLYCLSVGDSQGLIAVLKDGSMVHGMMSGQPHKPTDKKEAKRIKDSKGFIQEGRLWGVLGVSRSIGDRKYKKVGVVPTPNLMKIDVTPALFCVLACDGLWDVYPAATVAQMVHQKLQDGDPLKGIVQYAVREAISTRNSHDNVSVIVATFA